MKTSKKCLIVATGWGCLWFALWAGSLFTPEITMKLPVCCYAYVLSLICITPFAILIWDGWETRQQAQHKEWETERQSEAEREATRKLSKAIDIIDRTAAERIKNEPKFSRGIIEAERQRWIRAVCKEHPCYGADLIIQELDGSKPPQAEKDNT